MVHWFNRRAEMKGKPSKPNGRGLTELLDHNVRWANGKRENDPDYFRRCNVRNICGSDVLTVGCQPM